jgi:hypothetical protein
MLDGKPVIFISYSHLDEPEKPDPGEVKWLSFVQKYLEPAVKAGEFSVWIDREMPGGADWDRQIEESLRACDVFVLLVSPHSMSSDYVARKEIAIIRERQAAGQAVHFYPIVLTPTPKVGMDQVKDKNLRPRDGKPLESYDLPDRKQHMSDIADEIAMLIEKFRSGRFPKVRLGNDTQTASFGFEIINSHNPVKRCAHLEPGTGQGSSFDSFDLLPELRFGKFRIPTKRYLFSFGVTGAELQLQLDNCEIVGGRLGDSKHEFVKTEGDNIWVISGPIDDGVLGRRSLGDEILCTVKCKENSVAKVRFEVSCLKYKVKHAVCDRDGNEMVIKMTKKRIAELFINRCIGVRDDNVLLCSGEIAIQEEFP